MNKFLPSMPRDLALTSGKRYRIVYQTQGQRTPHFSVMDYLYSHRFDSTTSRDIHITDPSRADEMFFSARPEAGTQSFSVRWTQFLSFTEVPKTTAIVIAKRLPAGS